MSRYLPDTNVWLALTLSGHPHHEAASAWLEGVESGRQVLFCRATQLSLLRLLTTAAVFRPLGDEPLTNLEAWAVLDAFLADERISSVAVEPPGAAGYWRSYSSLGAPAPKLWMDAFLAGFARAAGAALVTCDTALGGYADLDVVVVRAESGAGPDPS